MIAEIPLSLELDDRVVSSPAYDGIEDDTLIAERAVGVVADGIAQEVTVAGRVGEVVFAVVLVHPRSLKETVWVASLHGFAILVEDNDVARCLGKLLDIVTHAYHAAGDGRLVGSGKEFALVVWSSTEVDESVLFAILAGDGSQSVGQRMPPLELSAPKTSEIGVYLSIVILEYARIDRE